MSNLSFYFDSDHEVLSFSSALARLINATALACVWLINTTAVRCHCIFVAFFLHYPRSDHLFLISYPNNLCCCSLFEAFQLPMSVIANVLKDK